MKIITAVVNNPIFISIQYNTLKKYFKGEYEFIVFNDAKDYQDITNQGDIHMKQKIRNMCKQLNVKCIDIDNEHHKTMSSLSHRHCETMNIMNKFMKKEKDIYLVLDSDMFLIDHFDIKDYEKFMCACVIQDRPHLKYFWANFFLLNTNIIQHEEILDFGIVQGGDSGSKNSIWLKQFPYDYPDGKQIRYGDKQLKNDKFYFIKHLWSCTWDESEFPENLDKSLLDFLKHDPRNIKDTFFCEIYDNKFLHLRGQSNWMKEHINKNNILIDNLKLFIEKNLKMGKKDHLVIARYNENLDWLNCIDTEKFDIFIYNKGPSILNLNKKCNIIKLSNIGRESHTYLTHILNHYKQLPNKIIFTQAHPFDHVRGTIIQEMIQFLDNKKDFQYFSQNILKITYENVNKYREDGLLNGRWWSNYHQSSSPIIKTAKKLFPNFNNLIQKIKWDFGTGAIFGVSRDKILQRDITFYDLCLKILYNSENPREPPEGHAFERLWNLIFNHFII